MKVRDGDGFLSTPEEKHVFVIGIALGIVIAIRGDMAMLAQLLAALLAGSRVQLGVSDDLKQQITKELPYLIGGCIGTYLLIEYIIPYVP